MSDIRKALVALVPFVLTLVAHFAGADSDTYFVAGAVVTVGRPRSVLGTEGALPPE